MPANLKGRSLLTLADYTRSEIDVLVESAIELKRLKRARVFPKNLANRNIAVIFLKPSCRTRSAFVTAAVDEGAHAEVLPREEIRFGIKESLKDVARVMGRMYDGIAFRGYEHEMVRALAEHSGVPVWNCLCDRFHPTQVLADFMTIREEFGRVAGIRMAYIGDGRNNMARSLAIGAVKCGIDLRIVAPAALQPDLSELPVSREAGAGSVRLTANLEEGVRDCEVLYSDMWVSMGEESLVEERIAQLQEYRVTQDVLDLAKRGNAIYLHCLPALHDLETEFAQAHPDALEVTDEVFEGPQSRVFEQAENRMHTAKAVMVATV